MQGIIAGVEFKMNDLMYFLLFMLACIILPFIIIGFMKLIFSIFFIDEELKVQKVK